MRSMLQAARKALGTLTEQPTETPTPLNPRFFIVSDEMKRDPSDIEGNFAEAVKENTAMTEPETGITDKFRAALTAQREWCNGEIEKIRGEQATADKLHADNLASLNEAIKTAETIHAELTAGNDARIADATVTLDGIRDALNSTAPKGVAAAPVATPTVPPAPPPAVPADQPNGARGRLRSVPVAASQGGDK